MSENMIERVAKAIREADEIGYSISLARLVDGVTTYELDYGGGESPLEFETHSEALEHVVARRNCARARAAIEAMREPTPEMRAAMRDTLESCRDDDFDTDHCLDGAHVWWDGIDAALKENADG